MADWSVGVKNEAPSAVVAVIFELVREKNTDQAEFHVLVKKNCVKHLDKDVVVGK